MRTLMSFSRRAVLGSVSAAAVVGSGLLVTDSQGLTPTDYFYEANKVDVSYDIARGYFNELIDREIDQARKRAGVKYSDDDIKRIKIRTWDHARYVLSEFYK